MFRIASLLAATLLIAGCASRPEPVAVPASAKTIAVVSAVPPEFRVATTGMTVFENALDVVDVADWHLDDVAADAAMAALSARFQPVRAKVDGPVKDLDTKLDKLFGGTDQLSEQVRRTVQVEKPVDLYLVVMPSGEYRGLPNINIGVGISKVRVPFGTNPPAVHTYLKLALLDGQTLKVIGEAPVRKAPGKPPGHAAQKDHPSERLDGFEWKNNWHEMSEAQQDLIRDRVKALLTESIPYTIREMRLSS